jgi:thymidylate synthase ThyX
MNKPIADPNIQALIIKDTTSARTGARIVSMQLTYPRIILAELNTHRAFSRSTASSRAIPFQKMAQAVSDNPFYPVQMGQNQKGMKAKMEIDPEKMEFARAGWERGSIECLRYADALHQLGVHKQVVNRMLEPWTYVTSIVTSTEWNNFFALRAHEDAQPEFQVLAYRMLEAFLESDGTDSDIFDDVEWHIPFFRHPDLTTEESSLTLQDQIKIAVARCARISYNNFNGTINIKDDIRLHDDLVANGHMSPLEHVAFCDTDTRVHRSYGNFKGWVPYRKTIPNENRHLSEGALMEILANKPDWI